MRNNKIIIEIDKKKCSNCESYYHCLHYGKECNEICEDWDLSFDNLQCLMEKMSKEQQDTLLYDLDATYVVQEKK